MKKKLRFSSIILILIAITLTACKKDSYSVELEDRDVYIKLVNNSQHDINYLQAVFETNYGEFFVNYGALSSGEVSEPILLPAAAHDVNQSFIKAEVAGNEGKEIEIGKSERFNFTLDDPLISGEYFYVIDLDNWLSKEFIIEENDYSESYNNEEGKLRFRVRNSSGIGLQNIVIHNVREECIEYNYWDTPEVCQSFDTFMYSAIEIDALAAGETSAYITLPYGYSSTYITAVTDLGDDHWLYPWDHGPYEYLVEEPGAYTYDFIIHNPTKIHRDESNIERYIWSPNLWD